MSNKYCKGLCDLFGRKRPFKNPYDEHFLCVTCGIGYGIWAEFKYLNDVRRCSCCNRHVRMRNRHHRNVVA